MGWSIGFDSAWQRDIGYGVPATCDHPGCNVEIDRGLSYVCGGEPYGGERGCGLYFCENHLLGPHLCMRCYPRRKKPFEPKPDHPKWIKHKLTHISWITWRNENPEAVKAMALTLSPPRPMPPNPGAEMPTKATPKPKAKPAKKSTAKKPTKKATKK